MPPPEPFPPLDTARLRLRCATPADAPAVSALMTDALSRWLGDWPMPYTPALAEARIRDWGALARAGRAMPCVLTLRDDGAVAGWIHCIRFTEAPVARMGYWCGEAFAGRGLVREAAAALVPAAFRALGVEAVEAVAQPANAASLAVLRAAGMRFVGEETSFSAARNREEAVLRFRLERPEPAGP